MHKKQFSEDDTTYSRVRLLVSYCLERDTFLRSTKTALVVGTTLAIINHGQQIFSAQFALTWVLPTAITYLVPFTVATYGQIQGKRQRDRLQEEAVALAPRSTRDSFLVPHAFGHQEPEQPSHFSISRPSFFLTSPSVDFGEPAQPATLCSEEDMWQLPMRQDDPSRHLQIAPRFTLPMKPQTARGSFTPAPFPDYASSILRRENHVYQGAG
jgi:hypothetical protein